MEEASGGVEICGDIKEEEVPMGMSESAATLEPLVHSAGGMLGQEMQAAEK